MMGEWNYIIAAPLAAMLFAIGGTGFKWARRYVLPVCLGILCIVNGIVWWKAALVTFLSVTSYCLPYGESLPQEFLKFLVFTSYFASLLVIGVSGWMIISPIILMFMFSASNQPWGEKLVAWKVWELTAGFLIGITLGGLL